jgi:hypothetical protein
MILHGARQHGFSGPQPIAVSESMALAAEFGCDKLDFVELISLLDAEYLRTFAKEHDPKRHVNTHQHRKI